MSRSTAGAIIFCAVLSTPAAALEDLTIYRGSEIPPAVEQMYVKGLRYLAQAVHSKSDSRTSSQQPAVHGMALLAFLAHGEDPNYGPYRKAVKHCVDSIIKAQKKENGYIGTSMYNHGFATLALAEAYGSVHDDRLGPALKKAVDLILASQKRNPFHGWRYRPESTDADTTVSGACFVALIAARNAGMGVPDKAIDRALKFYSICQSGAGTFSYTPGSGSGRAGPTTAIGVAAYAYARQRKTRQFARGLAALWDAVRVPRGQSYYSHYASYMLYYLSQALFQGDVRRWEIWNRGNIERLRKTQQSDGSWKDQYGSVYGTAACLLSLALNYRFLPIYER
jgi:hypothetical protein